MIVLILVKCLRHVSHMSDEVNLCGSSYMRYGGGKDLAIYIRVGGCDICFEHTLILLVVVIRDHSHVIHVHSTFL